MPISANLPRAEAVGLEPTGPERPAVFKTAAIAALPSLHAAEGKGLEPPDAHRASRFRGGCNRRSAIPPTRPASADGGESRIRTYGGREAPSRFQRDAIAALPSHHRGATGTRTLISGVRYRRSPVER